MADGERQFPDPGFEPGDYPVEWLVGKRWMTGDIALAARRRPQLAIHGKLRRPKRIAAGEQVHALPGPFNDWRSARPGHAVDRLGQQPSQPVREVRPAEELGRVRRWTSGATNGSLRSSTWLLSQPSDLRRCPG